MDAVHRGCWFTPGPPGIARSSQPVPPAGHPTAPFDPAIDAPRPAARSWNICSDCPPIRYHGDDARLPPRRPLRADRRSAAGDRSPRRRAVQGPEAPDASRRDRHGQDLHDRPDDPGPRQADPRPRPQQDARRPALRRVPRVLPGQRGRVLRQLLRLLPARGVPAPERHVHREGLEPERRDRPAPPRGDPRPLRASRRDHRGLGLVHLRPRRAGRLRGHGPPPPRRAARTAATPSSASSSTSSTSGTTSR